jgi:hypothetical protein
MKQIKVLKSIEGGEFKSIEIDEKLFNALYDYDKIASTFNFLLSKNFLDDTISEKLKQASNECQIIFREYNLDKYDVSAVYKFEESEIIK